MKDGLVLVDTCAWIDFFRNRQGALGDQVSALIEAERAALTGVVAAELLQGIKSDKEQKTVDFLIDSIAYLDTLERDWRDAGLTLQKLRGQGITVPLTDALIATVAVRRQAQVLTIDRHFRHLPVAIMMPPSNTIGIS